MDDICMRMAPIVLMRGLGLPSIATTHSDVPSHPLYEETFIVRCMWVSHLVSNYCATVHATVAKVYAAILWDRYRSPVHAVWPPVLWSDEFRKPPADYFERAAKERSRWISLLGFTPRAVLLYSGRWSSEKRIHLLLDAVPEDCALVVIGDSDSPYADEIEAATQRNVIALRGMLGAEELRIAYCASDLYVSASAAETLGNCAVEAWSAGIPVALQPAGGHLEFVKDNENSYLVNFDDPEQARRKLDEIVKAGASASVEPALSKIGEHFRTLDFPAEIQRILLEPALSAAAQWRQRRGVMWIFEVLLRFTCFVLCVCFWPPVSIGSRIYFALSCNPTFRYLPPGVATEEISSRCNQDAVSKGCDASYALLEPSQRCAGSVSCVNCDGLLV
ncbi:unnamed protein product [Polarella glacialis]|uniref:Glycosyl transferase family 1 domain-containing protein n=1 Tax=Polarella glacialis TaxID=89957 RepID=A0A813GBF9_POLGL|nr:unnamed protein product [Polarella glacialis]